ncbi:MAG: 16S rRNA processing protein RimM [Sphingobacteriales bacterium]|nr:MAG: 16S rRNA processing protein RimM [Sphingobacteriales bacterium]
MPLWTLENGIHAGKIIKQHGYLGNIRVAFSFSIKEEKLKAGNYLYIVWNEKPVPYLIETIQWQDSNNAIVKLADVDTEEAALKITKRDVFLPENAQAEDEEEEESEYEGLIGFSIVDENKNVLGEITDFIEAGPQILLEAQTSEGKEFLVPFHPDIIKKINRKKKTVLADLPEGLVDL